MAKQLPLVDDTRLKRSLEGVQVHEKLFNKLLKYDVRAAGRSSPKVRLGLAR